MHGLHLVIAILGRILLSAIFVVAGLNKVLNWEVSKEALLGMLSTWSSYSTLPWMGIVIAAITEHLEWFLCGATICELLGGILVMFGFGARFGAFLLIVFVLPTTVLFHPFWELYPPERDVQAVMFMKNAAILGGLLVVLAFGSGFGRRALYPKNPL